MSKRALVTGSLGFTGHYICDALKEQGWAVIGAGIQPSTARDYHQCDLLDEAQIKAVVDTVKPTLVIHLAAVAFVGHEHADGFYSVNILGTRNLLKSLARASHSPDCVIVASSANIYGNSIGGPLSEATQANPGNDYAVSKLCMEHMARLWMDKLPIIITRPFNYTGIGQSTDFLVSKIVDHFRRKAQRIELGNLQIGRDFSDVRDVARAYVALATGHHAGETVNICSGASTRLLKIMALASELTGHHIDIDINPTLARHQEVDSLCGDRSRLEALAGYWEPIPLRDTLRWMLEHATAE